MTTTPRVSAPRAPYTGLREGYQALMRKKDATLSGGAYARDPRPGVTTVVRAAHRSRFAHAPGDRPLGMGMVQAILAALTGAIRAISCDIDGRSGRATIDGVGSGETYQMSWDDHRTDYLLLGGFVNGATYQAALLGLVRAWAQRATSPATTGEIIDRWWALLRAMDDAYPRRDRTRGWDVAQVKAACQDSPRNAAIRGAIEALADALADALRYRLPDLVERGLYVQYDPCVAGSVGTAVSEPGSILLTLPDDRVPTPAPPADPERSGGEPAAVRPGDDELDADLDLDASGDEPGTAPDAAPPATPALPGTSPDTDRTEKPAAPPAATTSRPKPVRRAKPRDERGTPPPTTNTSTPATAPPTTTNVPLVGGAVQTRIARAFARTGDVFLYGVTATGKTTWAKQAAIAHGYGLEIVVFKPGVKDEMLYGTSVQDRTGRWVWQDGPIVRAARRATSGERIVLLLDELPRGDKSVVAGTMDVMNVRREVI